ncbi:MAG: serine/threonine protein kinase [Balneolaceae bacterium]|nr:MAG: serine/threonine protein kinase [Balneolaceae bacterium]
MNEENWKIALEVYDTIGDNNLEDFTAKLENLSLTREIKDLLIDLKRSENEASDYFDHLSDRISNYVEPPVPKNLGVWSILNLIDTGGMSSVYLAERDDGQYKMKAAAKFIHFSGYNPAVIKRFKQEMQFLALLDHPNITRIIDSGVTEHGIPWFIMEYVDGMPVTSYCNSNNLNLEERIRLFLQICDAVQHAHKNLVIHRDLKPSNIFVTHDGVIKLLDFGIAKAVSPEFEAAPPLMLTRENQALMTPEYASPEQLEGNSVNTASDVYSLGVILHELLTGRRPYLFDEFSQVKMLHYMKDNPLQRPSLLFKLSEEKPAGIMQARLSRELDDIVMTALRIEPERRYDSAEQFGRDLKNYLKNEPVMARLDSRKYRVQKFLQRNKTAALLSSLILLTLSVSLSVILWQSQQTRIEAEQRLAESERAVAMKEFMVEMITAANPHVRPGETPTALDLLNQGADMVQEKLADQPSLAAEMHAVIGKSFFGLGQMQYAAEHLEHAMKLIDEGVELDAITIAEIHYSYAFTRNVFGDFEGGLHLAESTVNDLDQIENSSDLRSSLYLVIHDSKSLLGDFDGAHESAKQAVALACSETDLTTNCIDALLYLKDAQYHIGLYEESFSTAERAWHLTQTLHQGTEHPQIMNAARIYANALYQSARALESIPIIEETLELAENIYGEISFNHAVILDDLGRAYTFTGQPHKALPVFQRMWDIGTQAEPRHSITPVWLIRKLQTSMDLKMDDFAENAYLSYLDFIPEAVPQRTQAFIDLQRFRILAQRKPGSVEAQHQIEGMLAEAREMGFPILHQVSLLFAANQAIERKDPDTAGLLLDEYQTVSDGLSQGDIQPVVEQLLHARRFLLMKETDNARQAAATAMEILHSIGHGNYSPLLAEARAVKAESYCKQGDLSAGRSLLQDSLLYWTEVAQAAQGSIEMKRIAKSCEE